MSLVFLRVVQVVMLASVFAMSAPDRVSAFELFGFKFFGSTEESNAEIIDPVAYAATLVADSDDRKLLDKFSDASLLIRKQSQPPSGTIGLIARARDDRANLLGLLYEEAFYGATVSIVIAGRPLVMAASAGGSRSENVHDTVQRIGAI